MVLSSQNLGVEDKSLSEFRKGSGRKVTSQETTKVSKGLTVEISHGQIVTTNNL